MKRIARFAFLLLSVSFALSSFAAQEANQSLGDLARKEREKKKAQSMSAEAPELKNLSSPETVAYFNMAFVALEERLCKDSLGTYVPWEHLFEGCRSKGVEMVIERKDDPRRDSNYEYRLTADKDSFELAVVPKGAGLAGYFYDGNNIRYNQNGPASAADKEEPSGVKPNHYGLIRKHNH